MSSPYDIAIIGSGFGGSLLAMIAQRLGHRVILLERGKHPRMAIGESSTPLSNLLLEELTAKYNLPSIKPLTKWGSWRKTHPELACGLKRGFTFFHHQPGASASSIMERENQLLVAASPHDEIGDTHWYRADFDHFLVREAQRRGIEYVDEVELSEFDDSDRGVSLKGVRHGREIQIRAQFVVDATGPRGCLHRALNLGERPLPGFPVTQAIYSHFTGAKTIHNLFSRDRSEQPPYRIDDAAVHHILDGGWVWVLRFSNGVTSAGIAAANEFAARLNFAEPAEAWRRLLAEVPALEAQFSNAQPVQPFRHIARLAFRSAAITGRNWALLPSAAGFVDPLLSTGFPLTLLGIARLAEIIERDWGTDRFGTHLSDYSARTDAELLAIARLIGALYANMANFRLFAALSLLYFAAASYAETVRRLGKSHLASSFLLHDNPRFGPDCERLLNRAPRIERGRESEELIDDIYRLIEPFDVAGLGNRNRRNWYPVDAEDLLQSAHKVGAASEEITRMLERCGFQPLTSRALA